ncbi:uncharacterized protein [Argopecten irradians]|uniref:uncharacterized protein n=1 Tax=Argopecten irradians TaxID=31199 RepID=UPI003721FB54
MQDANANANVDAAENEMDTSGYDSPDCSEEHLNQPGPSGLVVQLPFARNVPSRRNGPRKRISRAISKKSRQLKVLRQDYHKLKVKYRSACRSVQRLKKKSTENNPSTPRSKTERLIQDAGLTKEQGTKVRKQLLMSNAIMDEVKSAKQINKPGKQKLVRNIICGRITKKYRCGTLISKTTGICRNRIAKATDKAIDTVTQLRRKREVMKFRDDVIAFMERDDNSRSQPGKADKIKTGRRENTQKRTLTDYLTNLHTKFLAENPNVKLSLTSFSRIRPKYIQTTSFISRDSCLCTKHQNMALTLKAMRREGINVPVNAETYAKDPQIQDISEELKSVEVRYHEWKRVPVEEKGKKKMVMRMVQQTATSEEFVARLRNQTAEFQEHVARMRNQYEQIRLLKQKLPAHHAIAHMDFAENYNCRSAEEIQSAYWHQTGVTLHPVVIYTKDSENNEVQTLQHQSVVLISDELAHNSATVVTFLTDIVEMTKAIDPDIQCIHYWTDSPTSQYRNKTIFHMVANHEQLFGMKARWNYFEAGHGKGPCDGLGGTTKRMADQAMRSGKTVIQDASDFYEWTQSDTCSMQNVKFRFVAKERCESTASELQNLHLKPVKGTMKIHAVVGLGDNGISVRNVSCYCDACIEWNLCSLWEKEVTSDKHGDIASADNVSNDDGEQVGNTHVDVGHIRTRTESPSTSRSVQSQDESPNDVNIGEFVVALYDGKAYVGKLIDKDVEDNELGYKLSFMEQRKKMFQWPKGGDVLWCSKSDILFKIDEPKASAKSGRMFVVTRATLDKMEEY